MFKKKLERVSINDAVVIAPEKSQWAAFLRDLDDSQIQEYFSIPQELVDWLKHGNAFLPWGRDKYFFDYNIFIEQAVKIRTRLEKGEPLTARFLGSIHSFFVKDEKMEEKLKYIDSVPTIFKWASNDWPMKGAAPGTTMVIGAMHSGKTYYVEHSANAEVVIRFYEPTEEIDFRDFTVQANNLVQAISIAIILSYYGFKVAIDSFRFLMNNMPGDKGEGGISTGIYGFVTALNNICSNLGANIVVTLNPMESSNEAKADAIARNMGASVAGVIYLKQHKIAMQSHRLDNGRSFEQADPSSFKPFTEAEAAAEAPNVGEGEGSYSPQVNSTDYQVGDKIQKAAHTYQQSGLGHMVSAEDADESTKEGRSTRGGL